MGFTYEVRFSDDKMNPREFYGVVPVIYRLDDDSQIKTYSTLAWCCDCNDLVDAEFIPSLDEIQKHWEEVNDRSSERMMGTLNMLKDMGIAVDPDKEEEMYEKELREAELKLRWLKRRISKPKCLSCGSDCLCFPDENGIIQLPDGREAEATNVGRWSSLTSGAGYKVEAEGPAKTET